MPKPFNQVAIPRAGRSVFNLSHEKKFTGDFGWIYPSMAIDVCPGDVFSMSKQIVIRLMPMVTPIMHQVDVFEHTFFAPYRLLMTSELGDAGDFEDMIIGGTDGDTEITIPTWEPTTYTKGSLWDYMGFPIGVDPDGAYPVDFIKRAYNWIWNEYYRDNDLVPVVNITTSETLLKRPWRKDYFTSCRPWQQRGTSPALPISGVLDIDGKAGQFTVDVDDQTGVAMVVSAGQSNLSIAGTVTSGGGAAWNDPKLEVDLEDGITFDVNDIRLAIQVQRWMEKNARAGTRYIEFINGHFGPVGPRDDRLDRPEYIGGLKSPLIISEVLQTESSDASSDLGTMAGHGISVAGTNVGKYRVKEYGIIMSMLSVLPKTAYSQGIDKQWRKETLYDFYFPEFANLSEQAVLQSEIYATATASENDTVFGYQGRYNEMRVKQDIVCAEFAAAGSFDYWTFAREFASAPVLNQYFIGSLYGSGFEGGIRDEIFAASSDHHMMVSVGNIIKAVRPLPILPMPGSIDHN